MTTELATAEKQPLETAIPLDMSIGAMQEAFAGNLAQLTGDQRLKFYALKCKASGLNPFNQPFEWIVLNGKLQLYAKKGCAEELAKIHNVSTEILSREMSDGILIVRGRFTMPNGRKDEAIGAVPYNEKMMPADKANAVMKAETKCKRRGWISICSLGMLDESELDTIPKNSIAEVVTGEKTADERAADLNKLALTAGEKEKAIDVTEPQKESTAAVAVAAVPQPLPAATAEVKAPASDGAAAVSSSTDAEKMAIELETLFGENKHCVAYCVKQGKLEKGKGLEFIDREYGERVLKNAQAFIRKVEAWVKGGAK
jgi:hypothetical protein